ncbi:MAG: UvrD-helicase domain-containing protein [Oscillospiraceae bacterium]|nr:UvrD-helicase domain-containing protein [Oscillospiraceae bacterium]
MLNEFCTLRDRVIEKTFSQLNDMQLQAALSTEGPLLVLAGAGSGKTTVLVNRIANLIRFGRAYGSGEVRFHPDERDAAVMRDYLDGKSELPGELCSLLAVDAPRPWEILAITFTNKAANELKERIVAKLDGDRADIKDIWACTFHSACARILRRRGELLGYSSRFTIYDADDSRRVMRECQRILEIDDKHLSHKLILREISRAKDKLLSPEDYLKDARGDYKAEKIAQAYECYQRLLKTADAMDFDDIIANTVHLLEIDRETREYYQRRFKYIMVDEYQDTNHAQYRLTSILAAAHKNICVVGDDDQSIYRFRGATIENILSFENKYENARMIRLEQNYRSTQNILDAANAVISRNERRKGKTLWTANGHGAKLTVHTADDESAEGYYIAEKIMDVKSAGERFADCAVLYRMNAQSNSVESALVRMSVPYKIIGGHRFYERKEIRDALAYLTVVNNPADNVRLRRIINEPKRGIGEATLNRAAGIAAGLGLSIYEVIKSPLEYADLARSAGKLNAFTAMLDKFILASQTLSLYQLLELILKDSGYLTSLEADVDSYQDRAANLGELSANLMRYSDENDDPTLNGFLEEVALLTDIDSYNADADNVTLMTIHAAKGLEFGSVFIAGMEDGIFPGNQSMFSPEDMEEERRLAYVGVTRAKRRLYLTNARTRMLFGSTTRNPPSRFLAEIPPELTEQTGSRYGGYRSGGASYKSDGDEPLYFIGKGFSDVKGKNGYIGASPTSKRNAATSQTGSADTARYNAGDTVTHKVFGVGVVLSAKDMGNDCMLEIAFEKAGTKKVMAKFAKLTKN